MIGIEPQFSDNSPNHSSSRNAASFFAFRVDGRRLGNNRAPAAQSRLAGGRLFGHSQARGNCVHPLQIRGTVLKSNFGDDRSVSPVRVARYSLELR